ncbi:replication initiation protein [Stutzerimonas stutzeri]|uniref:replication initiation protein n=1 Tax=Stutzerimonas stutzeri TaxID=316 RepID=UPI001E80797A|nr:replication initiation protein [Stutzerimonas stutzeri]CAB5556583.1 replication protein [Stutzerimonas stutzeri]CAB5598013.1 replication protein [Stutzerimonas stutzeri]CAC9159116.1 replication protein [Stutzerimonas stutzeri]CAD0188348.1 Replication_partition [Stutzerimonas stutzeri]
MAGKKALQARSAEKTPQPLRVSKSNELITAPYKLTLIEQRLILAAISRLDPRKPMPKKVRVTASEYSDIYGLELKHAYMQMHEAADELYERDISIMEAGGRKRRRWVDAANYSEGAVEISFTIHVMPYLTKLYNKVTTYDLRRVARVDSVNTLRLFEMLMQFRKTGWVYLELEALRSALGLSDAYQRFNNFRQRVIDPSVKELREKCGLDVDYELIKEGRVFTAIKFSFKDRSQLALPLDSDSETLPPLMQDDDDPEPEWVLAGPIGDVQLDE